jgi:hypothetical protein
VRSHGHLMLGNMDSSRRELKVLTGRCLACLATTRCQPTYRRGCFSLVGSITSTVARPLQSTFRITSCYSTTVTV